MRALLALLAVIALILIAYIGVGVLHWRFLFGVVIFYAAAFIFLAGVAYRIVRWIRTPVPFDIPLVAGQQKSLPWIKADNINSPYNILGVIIKMVLDILFLRPLLRNENVSIDKRTGNLIYRRNIFLWLGAFVFHWSFLFIFLRYLGYFWLKPPSVIAFIDRIDRVIQPATTLNVTFILIIIALLYLILRRLIHPQIRFISLPSDHFAVYLLLAFLISGLLVRLLYPADFAFVKGLIRGFLTFKPVGLDMIHTPFYIHFFLLAVFLAYFPFSKLLHAPGVFFSPTLALMNDSRMRRHINPWNYPVKHRTYMEWEDEFRAMMRKAKIPVEKE